MPRPIAPDLVLAGARLWSPSGVPASADTVAVTDGRIIAVGPSSEVRRLAGHSTKVVRLEGCLLMPGLQDAHVHPILGGVERQRCDLSDASGIDAYQAAVATYAADHPDAPWIEGGGWEMATFPGGNPSRELLDAVVPERPVMLYSGDGHSVWVNGLALGIARIDAGTPDPPLGRIQRGADGAPMGTLHEHAIDLVAAHVPEPSPELLVQGLRIGQAYLHSLGITAWVDATVDGPRLAAYLAAQAQGWLTGRVMASLEWDLERGVEQVEDLLALRATVPVDGRVKADTVKIFQDGIVENHTAALIDDYLDPQGRPSGNRGQRRLAPGPFAAAVTALERAGFSVHVHAIGDQAVRDALDAFEAARAANGSRDVRHHIAHIQIIDPADIPRFAALDVTANAQPLWAAEDGAIRELTRPFLGDERTDRMYPFGSLVRAEARLAMGSDWSVSTPDPLRILDVAVNRQVLERRWEPAFAPAERITLTEGLRGYTRGSAHLGRLEQETAELAPGRLADLVVLDRDIVAPDAGPPADARVVMTFVDGTLVHESEAGAPR